MLYTYTATSQTVAVGEPVALNTNGINNCCMIQHMAGSTIISIIKPGIYIVDVNCDATSATAGEQSFTLLNNNVAVPGAEATSTIATANDISNFSFTSAIRVLPSCPVIDNEAVLTIMNTGANPAIISNIAVTIRRT